ncbi:hypothetical protein Emed_003307 [Eimeria media]
MVTGSKRQRSSSKAGRAGNATPQAEASEIRSLVVPVSAPPAGSYVGKAEKEQLVRGVVNSLHDEKGAVAQELFVDFPQCKRKEPSQQFEATEAATVLETIDTSVPPFESQSQQGKEGKQDAQGVRDAESLKATKLFRMLQRLASDPVKFEDLAQVPHSMSQQSQHHSLAASVCQDAAVVRAHQELSFASSRAINAALPDRAAKQPHFYTEKVGKTLGRRLGLTLLRPEMDILKGLDEAPLVYLKRPWKKWLPLQRQRLPLLRYTAESCCRSGPTQGSSGEASRERTSVRPVYRGAWSLEDQQAVLHKLRNSFLLPYAAFRRQPLGEWRVIYWSAMRGADFLMPIAFDHYTEATEPLKVIKNTRERRVVLRQRRQSCDCSGLKANLLSSLCTAQVSVSAMQKRICSMIGERIPLELLTRHAIAPPQLAEIQVVLQSKPVATLAFAFCHLLHWLSFGQTRRDSPRSTASAGSNGSSSEIASSPTLASTSACSSEDRMKASSEAHQQESQVKGGPRRSYMRCSSAVDLRDQKLLSRGQALFEKGAEPYQRATSAKRFDSQSPEKRLAENLLHFSKQKLSECNFMGSGASSLDSRPASPQSDEEVNNASEGQGSSQDHGGLEVPLNSFDRRLKALALAETLYKQIVKKIKTTFGAFGVAFVCPLMVLALKEATAWAIRQQMPKFFKQSIFHFELADRINALFSQLFDPQAYFVSLALPPAEATRKPAYNARSSTCFRHMCMHGGTSRAVNLLQLEKYLTNCPKPPVSASECFQTICSPLDLSGCTELLERQLQQLHTEVEQRSSLLQLGQTKIATPSEMSHKDTDPQYKLLRLQQEQHELLERRNPRAFEPISNWACPELRGPQTIPRCSSFTQRPSSCTAEPRLGAGGRKVDHLSGTSPTHRRSSQNGWATKKLTKSFSIVNSTAQVLKTSRPKRAGSAFISSRVAGRPRGLVSRHGAKEGSTYMKPEASSQDITAGAPDASSSASDLAAATQTQATCLIAEESLKREWARDEPTPADDPKGGCEAESKPDQPLQALAQETQAQDSANNQYSKLWRIIPMLPKCKLARASSAPSVKMPQSSTLKALQLLTASPSQQQQLDRNVKKQRKVPSASSQSQALLQLLLHKENACRGGAGEFGPLSSKKTKLLKAQPFCPSQRFPSGRALAKKK